MFYELLFEEAAHFNVLLVCGVVQIVIIQFILLLDVGDWRKVEFVVGHDDGVDDVAAVVAAIVEAHFGAMSLLCFSLRVYC